MFDFWYELPPLLRAGLGVLLLGIAILMFMAGIHSRLTIVIGVVGAAFLLFCKAGNDGGGYNF